MKIARNTKQILQFFDEDGGEYRTLHLTGFLKDENFHDYVVKYCEDMNLRLPYKVAIINVDYVCDKYFMFDNSLPPIDTGFNDD